MKEEVLNGRKKKRKIIKGVLGEEERSENDGKR